jgi:hypothetical protein
VKKLKPEKENPVDQHDQRGNEEYSQPLPCASIVVKDWLGRETCEAGGVMYSLLIDLELVRDVAFGSNRPTDKDSADELLRVSKEKGGMRP